MKKKTQKMTRNVALSTLIITGGVLFTVSGCNKKEKTKDMAQKIDNYRKSNGLSEVILKYAKPSR